MRGTALAETKKGGRRAWPPLLHRMVHTIRSNRLVEPGQHILVAVSGGPDSVALLGLFARLRASWGLTLSAGHINYQLRGAESDADQECVAALCRALSVPVSVRTANVRSRPRGTSLQAAARECRYQALREMAAERGADRIAVGHTADDQAETVLLWILRGAGLRGLAGMPLSRDGDIIRPLFDSTRREVLAYAAQAGLSYRLDSSNDKPLYLRNRIRRTVLPVLSGVVPSTVRALCRLADLCREDDRYLDRQAAAVSVGAVRQAEEGVWSVDRAVLQQAPPALQRRVVRDLLRQCDAHGRPSSFRSVQDIMHAVMGNTGFQRVMLKAADVLVERQTVRVVSAARRSAEPRSRDPLTLTVTDDSSGVLWTDTGTRIRVEQLARVHVGHVTPEPGRIVVDADRVSGPFVVRPWRPGDRFHPWGMKGRSKKLQDYFVDLKIAPSLRNRIPLLVAQEGIMWIVGYRQDERWRVTTHTHRCLVVTARPEL